MTSPASSGQTRGRNAPGGRQWTPSRLAPAPVNIRAIERLLLRHVSTPASGPTPEQRLVVAVICQAMVDSRAGTTQQRTEARTYLRGPCLDFWATSIGLEPEFVREIAIKAMYLPQYQRFRPQAKEPQVSSEECTGSPAIETVRRANAGLQF